MKAPTVAFDELDRKVIQELPLLVDVLAATGNKIARSLDPYYDELKALIGDAIKGKAHWRIERTHRNIFRPLSDVEYSNTTKIQKLEPHFEVTTEFFLAKRPGGKWRNYFYVVCGFYYNAEVPQSTGYYFGIAKYDASDRYGGVLRPRAFYESIKEKHPEWQIEIEHPEDGDSEAIYVYSPELDSDKLRRTFEFFRQSILTPFLRSIRW